MFSSETVKDTVELILEGIELGIFLVFLSAILCFFNKVSRYRIPKEPNLPMVMVTGFCTRIWSW